MIEPVSPRERGFPTRRAVLAGWSAGIAALAAPRLAGAQTATPVAATPATPSPAAPLPDDITAIINHPRYANARWGVFVADRDSGEVIYDLRGDERFLAASTTKLYPTSAALAAYGADYRFETPVYRTGAIGEDGALEGDAIGVQLARVEADALEEHARFRVRVLIGVEDVRAVAVEELRERGDDALPIRAGDEQRRGLRHAAV